MALDIMGNITLFKKAGQFGGLRSGLLAVVEFLTVVQCSEQSLCGSMASISKQLGIDWVTLSHHGCRHYMTVVS